MSYKFRLLYILYTKSIYLHQVPYVLIWLGGFFNIPYRHTCRWSPTGDQCFVKIYICFPGIETRTLWSVINWAMDFLRPHVYTVFSLQPDNVGIDETKIWRTAKGHWKEQRRVMNRVGGILIVLLPFKTKKNKVNKRNT